LSERIGRARIDAGLGSLPNGRILGGLPYLPFEDAGAGRRARRR
jgi:hypothetical protein